MALDGSTLTQASDDRVTLELPNGNSSRSNVGCMADAAVSLYGSVLNGMRYDNAIETISHTSISEALLEDAGYAAAVGEWQSCMREAGFDVGETNDYGLQYLTSRGATALQEQGAGQTGVDGDIITSVAENDATCQESTGLHEIREDLVNDARQDVARNIGIEINQYIAFQNAVLARALEVP